MAKYKGTYACGHEGEVNVVGKVSERQYWIDKEFDDLCKECLKEQREKEITEANEESKKEAAAKGLADLTGSTKQVSWATTIRQGFITDWEKSRTDMTKKFEELEEPEQRQYALKILEEVDEIYTKIMSKVDAKFWIEHKRESENARYFIACVQTGEVILTE